MNGLPAIDHDALRHGIQQCATVRDFINQYDSDPFVLCLRWMIVSQGNEDVDQWARLWAIRMRDPATSTPADVLLHECCNTCLLLIFELLDRYQTGQIAANEIIRRFREVRFENILTRALPLDRAYCLHARQYPGANRWGMHWIADQHVERFPQWLNELNRLNGGTTMNHRYLWLLDIEGEFAALGLAQNEELRRRSELERNVELDEEDEELERNVELDEEDEDMAD